MKKTKGNKTIAVAMAAMLCMGVSAVPTLAKQPNNGGGSEIVSPQNIAITKTENNLTLGLFGKLTCFGKTSVLDGYNAGVIVELQQYDGGWTTIKTWSKSSVDFASIDEDWYVEKGYSYRLQLTHKAYNSNWTQVESFYKYSNVVYY